MGPDVNEEPAKSLERTGLGSLGGVGDGLHGPQGPGVWEVAVSGAWGVWAHSACITSPARQGQERTPSVSWSASGGGLGTVVLAERRASS